MLVLYKTTIEKGVEMRGLLRNGRRKCRNIIIYGSANSGKFDVINSLSSFKYAVLGAEEAEVIFMNDLL